MAIVKTKIDLDIYYVKLAQTGDTGAFEQLVVKYQSKLYAMIVHMTSHLEDSRDLLQDSLTKAYRALKKFRGDSSFYTWIYRIARNVTLNYLKKKKRRMSIRYDELGAEIVVDPGMIDSKYSSNPRRLSSIHELKKQLNAALRELSAPHRAVVSMHDIQGIPHAEISRRLAACRT